MMITRRFEQPDRSRQAATLDEHTATAQRKLMPTARFEETLVRALAVAVAKAAREQNPSPLGRLAIYYVDVERAALTSAGLTGDAIESVLAETGCRLVSWAGAHGAATRRGDDHFVLLRYQQDERADGGDAEASERAIGDLTRHLQRPILVAGRRVRVACSVGVVRTAGAVDSSAA